MIENKIISEKRRQRLKLISYVQLCHEYKRLVANASLENSKKLLAAKDITQKQHDLGIYLTYKGKPLSQWISYYDSLISKYDTKINQLTQDIEEIRSSETKIPLLMVIFLMLATGLFMFAGYRSGITGMAVVQTSANITIINVAPAISSMNLTPAAPYTDNNLTCNATGVDNNLDAVSIIYRWYNNSVIVPELYNLSTVVESYTSSGDNWTCEAIPFDGLLNGTPQNRSVIILGSGINVTKLEITDSGLDYSNMLITPVEGSRSSVAIRAAIYDKDGYRNQNITAYLCDEATYSVCNQTNYTYAKNLSYSGTAPQQYTIYFTYNGSDDMPQFWKSPGTWKLYVHAIDGNYTSSNSTNFTYTELMAINYSNSVIFGSSPNQYSRWNNGTRLYIMQNFGNNNLSISWNASDMVGRIDTWHLNGTDFAIDDDNAVDLDPTNLPMVYLNQTVKSFEPASGLLRCSSDSCGNSNATLNTYYHIYPPNLTAGTYNTSITITVSKKS
jgi:hypothetical protein